jgi:hypothetical protein
MAHALDDMRVCLDRPLEYGKLISALNPNPNERTQ